MNTFWAEFMVDCFKCSIYTSKYISMFIHHIECTTLRELPIFPRSYVSCNYHIMNVRNVICIYVTIVQYPVHQDELFHYTWVQIPMSIEFNWLSFIHSTIYLNNFMDLSWNINAYFLLTLKFFVGISTPKMNTFNLVVHRFSLRIPKTCLV